MFSTGMIIGALLGAVATVIIYGVMVIRELASDTDVGRKEEDDGKR